MKAPLFRKKLTSFDLLPESVQSPKRFRKRIIRLAAAQVAIFICLGAAAVALNVLDGQAWAESYRMDTLLASMRDDPAVTAATYTRDINQRLVAESAFFEAYAIADFNPLWVDAVISADTGYMTAMEYGQGIVLLTGMANDMVGIEKHRQNLLDTDIFDYVRLGRIMRQDDERFFYEMTLGVR